MSFAMTKPDFEAMAEKWLKNEAEKAPYEGHHARLSTLLASMYAAGEADAIDGCAKLIDESNYYESNELLSYRIRALKGTP
jgi:hypothetical protein